MTDNMTCLTVDSEDEMFNESFLTGVGFVHSIDIQPNVDF